ncbi:hybrid sensor histidine kinase/response regulator [Thalassotalea euphylliae]|uniref:histidine kinase n=1 Tax=Thalassotalea euphylliae TaxID=1655234 RepID=A0A3E0UF73_9GAMM|nr:PAS domain-containing sensor histidine kinase [Thalassotalea euphylliae]REL35324.1 PAS domain S-box protein [Thalassotalea euphylliae]
MAESISLTELPIAVVELDSDGDITAANPALASLVGLNPEQLVGKPLASILKDYPLHSVKRALASEIANELDQASQATQTGSHKQHQSLWLLEAANSSLSYVTVKEHQVGDKLWLFVVPNITPPKEISEPLREDTRTTLEALDETYWEWDIASDLVYFSPELIAMLGYKRQALSVPSSFWQKHINEQQWQNMLQQVDLLLKDQQTSFNTTYQVTTTNNQVLWVNATARLKRDSDGIPERMYGAVRNVTETKSLIQQLRKQNNYLSLAEKISNSGHWRYDVVEQKMFWSTELYRIYGTEPHAFRPNLENELVFHSKAEREQIRNAFKRSIECAQSLHHKSTILQASGKKAKIETIGEVEVDSDGKVVALFGISRDITRSEAVFEKLKLLALVNYTIKVPIFFIDEDDNVVYQDISPQQGGSNTALFDYVNFSISEYMSLKKTARQYGQLKRTHISFDDYNNVFDLSVTYEADKGVYIWIVENVTDKFRKEQQQAISSRLALLGNTFGSVSHDINNVLGVALGAIEMLELKFSQGEQNISRYIERVKNAIDKGKSVTERLLAFTKKPMVKVVKFDPLKDILDNQYLFRQVLVANIELEINLPDTEASINFPQGEFINILLNLVINAQDAIKEQEKALAQNEGGKIQLTAYCNAKGSLEIHVKDSGIGIVSENLTKIFDPFYSSKSVSKGHGIGLANVYSTMYKHNAQIRVYGKSELGGAHFVLEFPCNCVEKTSVARSADKALDSSSGQLGGVNRQRILILDDEASIAEFVALFLESIGAETVHVSNKVDLIEAIDLKGPFDVFMTDMILPDTSGREATALVQQSYPRAKICSMSGYIDNDDKSWPYPVLRKPFNSAELSQFFSNLNNSM